MWHLKRKFLFVLILFLFFPISIFADDGVILTPALGGTEIKASSAGGEFTPLLDLIFEEINHTQIGPDNSDLILNLPSGFEFDTQNNGVKALASSTKIVGTGNCGGAGNKGLRFGTSQTGATSDSLTATSNSVTLHIKQASAGNCKSTLIFSGIKVHPTSSSVIAQGNITYSGTTQIAGLIPNETSLGALAMMDDIERDRTPPVITLNGESVVVLEVHSSFNDLGATVTDNKDTDIVVTATGEADTDLLGEYTISYDAIDSSGNIATTVTRLVQVVDTTPPNITLNGESIINLKKGNAFVDAGAVATDNYDDTVDVSVSGFVDTNRVGTYTLTYEAVDSSDNQAEIKTRTVNVLEVLPPIINLLGDEVVTIEAGQIYVDRGATAIDGEGNDISNRISVSPQTLSTASVGTRTITYNVSVFSGENEVRATPVTRTVRIVDTTSPILTLLGESTVSIHEGETYVDSGATATDIVDGDLTSSIEISGLPILKTIGTYTVSYSITDSSGNTALQTRTIVVLKKEEEIQEPDPVFKEKRTKIEGSYRSGGNNVSNNFYSGTSINIPTTPQVLGDSTHSCDIINFDGSIEWNVKEVKKLQRVLNKNLIINIPITGALDELTKEALNIFGLKYKLDTTNNTLVINFINKLICDVD